MKSLVRILLKKQSLQRFFGLFHGVVLAAGILACFGQITWRTFSYLAVADAISVFTLILIMGTMDALMLRAANSTGTGVYQRILFHYCRWKLLNYAVPDSPLLAYPFVLFVELTLPQHFKEGGMKLVFEKINSWGDEFKDRFTNAMEEAWHDIHDSPEERLARWEKKRKEEQEAYLASPEHAEITSACQDAVAKLNGKKNETH